MLDSSTKAPVDAARTKAFLAVMALLVVGTTGYLVFRARSAAQKSYALPAPSAQSPADHERRERLLAILKEPHISYRSSRAGEFGKVVVAALGALEERRVVTSLACERLYFAGGSGLCVLDKRGALEPQILASLVDGEYRERHRFELPGIPSRTRVSHDGKYAVSTAFVSGDSYNTDGFSTRTNLFDVESAEVLADIDEFDAFKDGKPFRAVDFNYWGVSFIRGKKAFYATLGTGGETYLVEGDIEKRTIQVLPTRVECPSLSPDGQRIAFKRRNSDPYGWRLHVLDLKTKQVHALVETRNVDDQVEWLDNDHLLYGLTERKGLPPRAMNVWVIPVAEKTSEQPRIFVSGASSPVVEAARR